MYKPQNEITMGVVITFLKWPGTPLLLHFSLFQVLFHSQIPIYSPKKMLAFNIAQ